MAVNPMHHAESISVRGTKIDKIRRYRWRQDTKMGDFRLIDKRVLQVDHDYQRGLKNKVVDIAANFSWPAFGTLSVAERADGALFVFDGQQRHAATLRRSDITVVPCMVYRMEDRIEEAGAFRDINNERKSMTAVEKFKSAIMVGDAPSLLVRDLVAGSGLNIVDHGGGNAGSVRCVRRITELAAMDPDRLRRIWPLAVRVCEGHPLREEVVAGLFYIEDNIGGESLCSRRWSDRVLAIGYDRLCDGIRAAMVYFRRGGMAVWAQGIVNAINKGLRNELSFHRASDGEQRKA